VKPAFNQAENVWEVVCLVIIAILCFCFVYSGAFGIAGALGVAFEAAKTEYFLVCNIRYERWLFLMLAVTIVYLIEGRPQPLSTFQNP